MAARPRLPRVDVNELAAQLAGSLGAMLEKVHMAKGMDLNLADPLPSNTDGEWLLAHLHETHDFWHAITGFNLDLKGEVGLGGFYLGQLPNSTFFGFMVTLVLARSVLIAPTEQGDMIASLTQGYKMEQRSRLLVGLDWPSLWHRDLRELRKEFKISGAPKFEPLVMAA